MAYFGQEDRSLPNESKFCALLAPIFFKCELVKGKPGIFDYINYSGQNPSGFDRTRKAFRFARLRTC